MAKFMTDHFTCDMTPRRAVFELLHTEGHRPGGPSIFETKATALAWVRYQRKLCSNLTLRFCIYKLSNRKDI